MNNNEKERQSKVSSFRLPSQKFPLIASGKRKHQHAKVITFLRMVTL
jgi:hypothetical protein